MQGRCEAMPVDMGWPHALNFDNEVYEYARQDGFHDIDIAAELLRLASCGLSSVQKATCLAECLQLQLASATP